METVRIFLECNGVIFLSLGIMYAIQNGITKLIRMVKEEIRDKKLCK